MGRYVSGTQARKKMQQVFTASGTFTPSAGLLAAGGVVHVRCVGGGGGGGFGAIQSGASLTGGGGGSGADIERYLTVSAATPVTIGAGGAAGVGGDVQGKNGGTTSFGASVIAPGGKGGNAAMAGSGGGAGMGGDAGGPGGQPGRTGTYKDNNTTRNFSDAHGGGASNGGANSGGGGSSGQPGCSGICIVTWEE